METPMRTPKPTYRDTILPHAAALFASAQRQPGAELFVNLLRGGQYGSSVEVLANVDTAAEKAEDHPTLGRYFATIHVGHDGSLAWLDLSDHADRIRREAEDDSAEERAHVRGLTEGAGRRVL
jgi:hypothetical protein